MFGLIVITPCHMVNVNVVLASAVSYWPGSRHMGEGVWQAL